MPDTLVDQRRWRAHAQRISDLRRATGFDDPQRVLPDRAGAEHRRELEDLRAELDREHDAALARGLER